MSQPRRPFTKPSFPKPAPAKAPAAKPAAPAEPKLCAKCSSPMEAGAQFCGECGTAVKTGLKPKRSFADIRDKAEGRKNRSTIRSGRNYLLMIGIFEALIFAVLLLVFQPQMKAQLADNPPDVIEKLKDMEPEQYQAEKAANALARNFMTIILVTAGLPALIYFGLFVWAKTNPLPAITAGMITYITSVIAWIVVTQGAALGGALVWVYRIGVIGALSDAIRSATSERRRAEKKKRQQERERMEREAAGGADEEAEPAG